MTSLTDRLTALHRPRLLVDAARAGLDGYMRRVHLARLLNIGTISPSKALGPLLDMEEELDRQRRSEDAGYSYMRHVDVLIGVLGEAQILNASALVE